MRLLAERARTCPSTGGDCSTSGLASGTTGLIKLSARRGGQVSSEGRASERSAARWGRAADEGRWRVVKWARHGAAIVARRAPLARSSLPGSGLEKQIKPNERQR